jgi:hypothetical protein
VRIRACVIALALTAALPGCMGMMRPFTPGVMQQGAHPHAFQTASFAYAFMNGHAVQYNARLDLLEKDGLPFLEAVRKSKYTMLVDVAPHTATGRSMEYEYYDVNLRFLPTDADGHATSDGVLTLTGVQGTEESVQTAEDAKVADALAVDAGFVKRGHMAVYALVTMLSQLNASNDSMQRHAFALLVVKEKVKNGEKADWFDGTRPPEETAEDVDIALRVIADHHAATAAWRAEIVALAAMVQEYRSPVADDALRAQIAASKSEVAAWQSAHHQPTVDEYGVKPQELKLPTPDNLLAALDKDGYVSAAIDVAKGLATGNVGTTLDGLMKLAPKDGSIHTALEGVTAAVKGDIGGAIDAVAKLAGAEAEVDAVKARLAQVKGAVADVKNGIAQVRADVGQAEGIVDQSAH